MRTGKQAAVKNCRLLLILGVFEKANKAGIWKIAME